MGYKMPKLEREGCNGASENFDSRATFGFRKLIPAFVVLVAACSTNTGAKVLSGRLSSGPTVSSAAPVSAIGDGVCASSLAQYQISLVPAPAGMSPQHTSAQAVALATTSGTAGATATYNAYYALVTDPSVAGHNQAVTTGAIINRPSWVVEIGGLSIPAIGPYRGALLHNAPVQGTVFHHELFIYDDIRGLETLTLVCP